MMFLIIFIFPFGTFGLIYNGLCDREPSLPQCLILENNDRLPSDNSCDPIGKKDCKLNDFVRNDIASCEVPGNERFYIVRCRPVVTKPLPLIVASRIVAPSFGDQSACVAVHKGMKIVCGENGTRCVCDTGDPSVRVRLDDYEQEHVCRCQWFIEYCTIPNICSGKDAKCKSIFGDSFKCDKGSVNHCLVNPKLCDDKDGYCVELPDQGIEWIKGKEKEGEGFACINREIFKSMKTKAHYCDFSHNDHSVTAGKGFRRPSNKLDYCCYQHLVCIERGGILGEYLFKKRPCYCTFQFKNCLLKLNDVSLVGHATAIIDIVDSITLCSMDDSGKCNPLNPVNCNKGDLIDPSIAHCRINCKTGPLLPIEQRSCRIRKCIPPSKLLNARVIDVPYYEESSRCDPIKELPIECGMKYTRCVCDGKPTFSYFTDGCRCQYWPD